MKLHRKAVRVARPSMCFTTLALLAVPALARPQDKEKEKAKEQEQHALDPAAHLVDYDPKAFGPDPHPDKTWNAAEQEEIYAGKHPVTTQRPLLELGRELYTEGPFQPGRSFPFGESNLLFPHLMVYGDWRTAAGWNDVGNTESGQVATRLNLDIDLKLTATERIHAFMQPFERNGDITRYEYGEDNGDDGDFNLDGNLDALFFEGDLGAILRGSEGTVSDFDMPFAVGLMPLLFQNGVWVEDAFTGAAVTLPAHNSKLLNISNYDVTFFAGLDKVETGAVANGDDDDASIFGFNSFLEALTGYFEIGYGYTSGKADVTKDSLDYHNFTAAFTRRYGGWLSNSVRTIVNFGQDSSTNTADGYLILVENSLITSNPYGFLPYFNLFFGSGHPESLARAAAAGGVLKNTGINYEADALTAFPSLDATGHDSVGGALGLEMLLDFDQADPSLRQQIVFELAAQHAYGSDANDFGNPGENELAVGVRYQKPLSNRFIFRADATAGALDESDDYVAVRVEFRWKF